MWKECQKKEFKESVEEYPRRETAHLKPSKRWLDGAENYLKKMGIRGQKLILKEARVLHRP
jgi:hypothetical protein